jgi:hypothetical protein
MSHHSYSYLERRYSKKTRLQVFLLATGLSAAFIGGLVVLQLSETDAERHASAQQGSRAEQSVDRESVRKRQNYTLRVACELGPDACAQAQEEIRKQNCQLYSEGCKSHGTNRPHDPFMDDLDKFVQERMRNPQ